MRRRPNDGAEEIDEHNQPTEPFDIRLSPFARTVTDDQASSDTTFASPPNRPAIGAQPPAIGAYPYLPPPPTWQNKKADDRPAGGMNVPEDESIATTKSGKRQSIFPALVGLCFVLVQVLLLVSFALKMIGQWNDTVWAGVIFLFSDVLAWPLQVLVQQISLPFTISSGMVILVAILLYGVLSRILVRGLKLFLHSR